MKLRIEFDNGEVREYTSTREIDQRLADGALIQIVVGAPPQNEVAIIRPLLDLLFPGDGAA